MNAESKANLIIEIRARILGTTSIKSEAYAEEIARRWVEKGFAA